MDIVTSQNHILKRKVVILWYSIAFHLLSEPVGNEKRTNITTTETHVILFKTNICLKYTNLVHVIFLLPTFLIFVICACSFLFCLISLASDLPNLLIFSENQILALLSFFIALYSIDFSYLPSIYLVFTLLFFF